MKTSICKSTSQRKPQDEEEAQLLYNMKRTPMLDLLQNIAGVYTTSVCGKTYSALYWGSGFSAGLQRLELIANDHTYTFKTTDQKFDYTNKRPYGP